MPTNTVPANAGAMPKFDRASIMRRASAIYRRDHPTAARQTVAYRRWAFSQSLKSAWMTAKYEAKEAARSAEQKRTDRINELKLEIMRLDAKPFGMRDNLEGRAKISARINALMQEGA